MTDQNFISYSTIADKINEYESLLTNITGEMFNFWLKFVKKQIDEVEKVLFTDKKMVDESSITHAFIASNVSSNIELNSSLNASNNAIPINGIT